MAQETVTTNAADAVLSRKERFFFSLGDFNSGSTGLVTAVYAVYLVANGLKISTAAIIIMVGKIWGAFAEPIIGTISDNTRSNFGRRRPFMVAGGALIVFSFALLFFPLYYLDGAAFKILIYLTGYILYMSTLTLAQCPYIAMGAEITANHDERNKMNTLRTIVSFLSSLLSAGIPILLTESLNAGNVSVTTFSLVMIFAFGTLYALPTILAAVYSKERVPVPLEKYKFSIKEFFRPLKVKAFRLTVIMYVLIMICADVVGANIIYMAEYGMNIDFSAFNILAVMMAAFAFTIPLHNKLMVKFSKAKLYRIGIPLYIVGAYFLCFYPENWNQYGLYLVAVVIGVGMCGAQNMPWFIFPDVTDIGELKNGSANPGIYGGVMTFSCQIITAIAMGLAGVALQLSGFVEPGTDANGIVETVIQPPSAVLGLRLTLFLPILIFVGAAFFVSIRLKISPERSKLVTKILHLRRENKLSEMTADETAEYEKIQKELY
ncbi:MAG: MFS transporter [Christensenellaceae bacterium]|jgi:Na+/melibiose symporter-like transporter|nr:MFS transporter [Christensenellaceae bacterium]